MNNKIEELEYLMNPNLYEKWIDVFESDDNNKTFKEELKFYKKRIIQITKDLLKDNIEDKSINSTFLEYSKSCIEYFKCLDRKDILQEEYKELILQDKEESLFNEKIDEKPDEKLINPNYVHKKNTINDYFDIKKISNKAPENLNLPKQKELSLDNPSLKIKGVKNKNKNKNKKIKENKK